MSFAVDRVIDALRAGGYGPKAQRGGKYKARCPAHDDRDPSLSVREGEDGKAVVHCFGGCRPEAVVEALGLTMSDLFPPEANGKPETAAAGPRKLVAEYLYRDEAGLELFRVARFEPKDFRQGHVVNGQMVWNLKDVRRVLYGLPELIAAPLDAPVYYCEGEKDVEACRKQGLVATCNAGGAGKFREEYASHFAGRAVIIVADKDEPGRAHAETVSAGLGAVALSVRIVEAKTGKDAHDHFAAGHTADDFVECKVKKRPTRSNGYELGRIGDLLREPPEEHPWLVEGLLVLGGTSLFGSKPKVGKSTLLRALALSVARGTPFLGRECIQGTVIYLALEEKKAEVIQRFREMGCTDEDPIYIHTGSAPVKALELLVPEIERLKPVLIIIDPLFKWVRVPDTSDYAKVSAALEPVIDLSRDTGAHLAMAHHLGKGADRDEGDSVLGSTAIFGAVDALVSLRKTSEYRTVKSQNRYGEDLEETVITLDKETSFVLTDGTLDSRRIGALIKGIEELLKGEPGQPEKEIRERMGGNTGHTSKALREGFTDGRFTRTGTGKKGDAFLYFLAECSFPVFPSSGEQGNEKTSIVEKEVA